MATSLRKRRSGLARGALCVIFACGTPASPTFAQSVQDVTDVQYEALLRRNIADAYANLAFSMVRTLEEPSVDYYRLAALLLEMSHRLTPDDSDLLRSQIEAWKAAGDEEKELSATRELVRLDPKDTVAQLRVLNAGIRKLQDADLRMSVYERLLGREGSKLDDSIRSRLALDAAMLAREMGDERGFLDKLTFAVTADVTNKDAAVLFATYFLDRTDSPRERVDILANVVLADPLDADAHRNLANELMRHGAYPAAKRFYERMGEIRRAGKAQDTPEILFDYLLSVWNADGPARAIELIRAIESKATIDAKRERQRLISEGYDPGEERPVVIAAPLETVRLSIFAARGDNQQALPSLNRAGMSMFSAMTRLKTQYKDASPELAKQVADLEKQSVLELLWLRLISGQELDGAAKTLERLKAEAGDEVTPEAMQRYDGWMAALLGDTDEARRLLEPLADKDLNAHFGLAVAAEKDGNVEEAIRQYTVVARTDPVTSMAAMARMRIERLQNRPLEPTPVAKELNQAMLAFAPWLDQMTSEPRSFCSLSVEHTKSRIDALGRVELRVRLRNELGSSGIPLGVGVDRPINSRILMSPLLNTSITQQGKMMRPEVLRLDRRLRLKPGEAIDATFWGGRWKVGELLDAALNIQTTLRWRAIQGFNVTTDGRYELGPLCVGTDSDLLTRELLQMASTAGAMADEITLTHGPAYMRSVMGASLALRLSYIQIERAKTEDKVDELPPQVIQERQIILSAIAQRMPSLSPLEQAFTLLKSRVGGVMVSEVRDQLLELLKSETDPVLMTSLLFAMGNQPDPGVITRAEQSPDPTTSGIATLMSKLMAQALGSAGEQSPDPMSGAAPGSGDMESAGALNPETVMPAMKPVANPDAEPEEPLTDEPGLDPSLAEPPVVEPLPETPDATEPPKPQ